MATPILENRAGQGAIEQSDQFSCSPCSRGNKKEHADVYCLQCEEYLCIGCLGHHNRFAKMAAHTLLSKGQMESRGPQTVQPLLMVSCDLHQGQVYTVHCGQHDKVCCGICVSTEHRNCDEVNFLPDQARDISRDRATVDEFIAGNKLIHENLQNLIPKRMNDVARIKKERDNQLTKIYESRKRANDAFDVLEMKAVKELNGRYEEFKGKIKDDIKIIEEKMNKLEHILNQVENASEDTELFIRLKTGQQTTTDSKQLEKDVSDRLGAEKLVYQVDIDIEDFVQNIDSLGKLTQDTFHSLSLIGQYDVKTGSDMDNCYIRGMQLLEDGETILMTDWANKSLKKLDALYRVIAQLDLEAVPHSVCSTDEQHVAAVTLTYVKKIQFVVTGEHMAMIPERSITTPDCCRGLCYKDNALFVACGGCNVWGEGPGHVCIYTLSGTLTQTIPSNLGGRRMFNSALLGIRVTESNTILVCERDNGLVALALDGETQWILADPEMVRASGVCVTPDDRIFICCLDSNNVVLANQRGEKMRVMLDARDGILNPQSAFIDRKRSRLVIGMLGNNIRVYNLE